MYFNFSFHNIQKYQQMLKLFYSWVKKDDSLFPKRLHEVEIRTCDHLHCSSNGLFKVQTRISCFPYTECFTDLGKPNLLKVVRF